MFTFLVSMTMTYIKDSVWETYYSKMMLCMHNFSRSEAITLDSMVEKNHYEENLPYFNAVVKS